MHKSCQQQSVKEDVKTGSWDWAIEQTRERIKRLQAAIRVFEDRKEAGDAWPGIADADAILRNPA